MCWRGCGGCRSPTSLDEGRGGGRGIWRATAGVVAGDVAALWAVTDGAGGLWTVVTWR